MSVRITINKACDRCGKPFLLLQLKPGEVPVESEVPALKVAVKGVLVANFTDICNDCEPVVQSLIAKLCLDPASSISKLGQGMQKPAQPAMPLPLPVPPVPPVEASQAAPVVAGGTVPVKVDGRSKAARQAKLAASAGVVVSAILPVVAPVAEASAPSAVSPQVASETLAPAPVPPKPKIVMIDEPSPVVAAPATEKNGVPDAIVHPF